MSLTAPKVSDATTLAPRTPQRAKEWSFAAAVAVAAAVIGAGSLLLAYVIRIGSPLCNGLHLCGQARAYLAVIPFAAVARGFFALRRRPWRNRRPRGHFEETVEAIRDAALGSVAIVLFTFLFRGGSRFRHVSYSRLVFVLDWLIATLALVALAVVAKAILSALRRRGHNHRNIVIVGDTEAARTLEELVAVHPEMGYSVVATLRDDPELIEGPTLREALLDVARRQRVDEVVLAVPRFDRRDIAQLVSVAELVHLEIKTVPELFGLPPSKVSLGALGHMPVMELLQEPLPGGRRAVKRGLDVVIAVVALVAISPVMLLIAAAIRLTSRGPVLLRQERIGMDGRPFAMLKFRTMHADADATPHQAFVASMIRGDGGPNGDGKGALYKLTDDPRVTAVGRALRRLSLDELPQLANVLRGEMSLVGPRPALPFEVGLYEEWHRRRLEVRPGMTGPWQVGGRGRLGFDEMVALDIAYMEQWSPLRDLLILLRTVPAIFRRTTA